MERGEEEIQANLPDGAKGSDKQETNQSGGETDVPKREPVASVDNEEPTVGAALPPAQESAQETSTENVQPVEPEKSDPSKDSTKLEQNRGKYVI